MTADKAGDTAPGGKPAGASGPAPGAPKRPTPTIELQAEEVRVTEPQQAESAAGAGATSGGEAGEAAIPAEPQPSEAPVQRTSAADLRAFMTHLAAGLFGGLIGVLGAGLVLERIALQPPPADQRPEENRVAIGELRDRVDELQARLEQAGGGTAETQALQERVARLESTLQGVAEAAAKGGGALAQATALSHRITELEKRLDGSSARLEPQLARLEQTEAATASLKATVDKLAAESAQLRARLDDVTAAAGAAAELGRRLDEVEQRLAATARQVEQTGKEASAGGDQMQIAALALASASLERAVASGQAYAAELAAVRELVPSDVDLSPLEARAERGVATLEELQSRFEDALRKAAAAEPAEPAAATGSLFERLLANARSVVSVRRVDVPAEPPPHSPLVSMRRSVQAGDLDTALAAARSLSPAQREAMQSWLEDASARLTVQTSLQALHERVVARLGQIAPRNSAR